jgi:CheY-like chemotaxis protein
VDGREALREIKSDSELRRIPVVVLTTSEAERDILESYNLGVNAFVTKPVSFDALADAMDSLGAFWFDLVKLPPEHDANE